MNYVSILQVNNLPSNPCLQLCVWRNRTVQTPHERWDLGRLGHILWALLAHMAHPAGPQGGGELRVVRPVVQARVSVQWRPSCTGRARPPAPTPSHREVHWTALLRTWRAV